MAMGNRYAGSKQDGPTKRELLAEFPKNNRGEKVQFNKAEFSGKETIDIRTWWINDSDELCPGKGLNIPVEKWDEFVQTVVAADGQLKKK